MSDIFREVQEDVRRERLQKIWKTYGDYIIGVGVLLFAGIAAFELWQRHEADEQARAAASLISAQRISNPVQAADALNGVAKSSPKGYALVARLGEANAMYASGQGKNAITLYKQIAAEDDGVIGATARLRAAWGEADIVSRGELSTLLAPLLAPGNAWAPMAREILAYADYRALDLKSAQMKYERLAADPGVPQGVRVRARAMAQFIRQGGASAYGSVPAAAPAAPDAAPAQ